MHVSRGGVIEVAQEISPRTKYGCRIRLRVRGADRIGSGRINVGYRHVAGTTVQVQAGYRAHQISLREDLFWDFIVAASKAYSQALMSNRPELQDLVGMYSLVNTMQVLCFPRTIACAEQIVNATVETYFQPNKTFDDIRAMIQTGTGINPLSEFAEAARDELRALGSR
jgi:hypothetical protein